ncbi:beta-1,3-glucan recognition protein 3 [Danaus plexippus plexippus]|uniref:Beta-1,3-glucan recognition protein 3 n=1 Tax=Danaus plexippus plexippus TaxID=278856 RepID=A0A212ELV2_DANPL|nr:beta-1,3-glucan recognition protein 3 [Danaus plexippus plexippus]
MFFLFLLIISQSIGTPRPFERYLDAPVLTSVSGTVPPGLFITWKGVSQRADDPVLGFKIKLWILKQETNIEYELLNAEEYPGYIHNIKPSKSFRINETLGIPWKEFIVEREAEYIEYLHIQNLDYNVVYEVRVLAYKIDQEGPMSEPIRIKLVKVGENLGHTIKKTSKAQNTSKYVVPKATVKALQPNGFRIYIPGDDRIKMFHIEANFYSHNGTFYKSIREFSVEETNGYWMYEDLETPLRVGDTVVYYIFVAFKRGVTDIFHWLLKVPGYTGQGRYKITEKDVVHKNDLLEPSPDVYNTCKRTATEIFKGKACSDKTIFEDNFDTFRNDLWQIEQYIPHDDPYHPFVAYQNKPSNPTVFVEDGLLVIKPRLPGNITEFSDGSFLYEKSHLGDECTNKICADQPGIFPAVLSGKLKAKVAFTYGIVEIRAKMPIGDWLYPEIQLESLTKKYGNANYSSGVLKIASVNSIEQYVDGEMWYRFRPGRRGLRSWLPLNCRKNWFELLGTGGKMAPFDHHFSLTLGVAVGGMIFPDNITGTVGVKPWRNKERRALQKFWKDLPNWYQTWTQPLLIDYVKISAL